MHEEASSRRYRLEDGFGKFVAIPNEVVRSKTLSGNAKALYAILVDVIVFKREEPTQLGLGELLGGGEKTARTALIELRDEGLLHVHRPGQGKPNDYTLLLPKGASEPSVAADPSSSLRPKKDKPLPPTAATAPLPRPRDVLWDTLVEIFGGTPGGKSERGAWNTALRDIRANANASAETLRAAAQAWPRTYERATMTPTALARHWTILTGAPKSEGDYRNERLLADIARLDGMKGSHAH